MISLSQSKESARTTKPLAAIKRNCHSQNSQGELESWITVRAWSQFQAASKPTGTWEFQANREFQAERRWTSRRVYKINLLGGTRNIRKEEVDAKSLQETKKLLIFLCVQPILR